MSNRTDNDSTGIRATRSRTTILVKRDRRASLPNPDCAAPRDVPSLLLGLGACVGADPELFAIDDAGESPDAALAALELCAQCPVRRQCLAYAVDNEPFGIWGGKDAFERQDLRGGPLPDVGERIAAEKLRVLLMRGESAAKLAERYGVSARTIERWKGRAGLVAPRAEAS